MGTPKSNPARSAELEVKFRSLAIEDGVRETAQALASEAGLAGKPPRPRKSSRQFPFETALRRQMIEMEARQGALIERAPDALVVCNSAGVVLLVNERCDALFGYPVDALLGKPIGSILTGDFVDGVAHLGAAAALEAGGERCGLGLALTGRRTDGSSFAVEALAQSVDGGAEPLLMLSLRDSSQRRAVEKRLTREQARLRDLLDAGPDALLEVSRRGRILYASAQVERLLGYTAEELSGDNATRFLPDAIVTELAARDSEGGAQSFKCEARRKEGSTVRIDVRVSREGRTGTIVLAISLSGERQPVDDVAGDAFQASPDPMIVVDRAGVIQVVNRQMEARFGYGAMELIGKAATLVLPQGLVERLDAMGLGLTEARLAQETGIGIAVTGRNSNGERLALELLLSPIGEDGRLVVATLRNARREQFAQLPAAAERSPAIDASLAEMTLGSIGDALLSADHSGGISFMNEAAERLTGWAWQEARGRQLDEVMRLVDNGAPRLIDPAGNSTQTGPVQLNVVLVRRDGTELPIEGSSAPIDSGKGAPLGQVLLFRDASQSQARVQQIAHIAQHDPLTGLPNRVLLNDRISTAISIAPRHHKKVGVLFLDLDGFKRVNDTLGHTIGDRLLKAVADRLMTCVRGSDTVSRIGGDEFVVLLSEVERAEDSAITARRMLEAVSETYTIDRHDLNITVSIGVSVYPDDGVDAETLIKNADAAMYQAKENGRKGYQFYKPAMNLRAIERQDIEDSLRQAIGRDEFSLHFQPKVNLHTGEIAGAEALLRWDHPTRGPMPPALFMPVAEASGLIQPIGSWVMREACRQTQSWRSAGLMLPMIAINISGVQFANGRFVDGVFEMLSDTGLDPRMLELELTEGALMKQADHADSILRALDAGGIHLSLDDFGTGYSNLDHLRKFPIHTLKIDQSFVREITVADADASVVTMVLSMARSLNLRVAAEGVETSQELEFLQLHHCDEAQGFYFSRPLPAPQFTRLLKDGLVATMAARRSSQSFGRLRGHALPPVV